MRSIPAILLAISIGVALGACQAGRNSATGQAAVSNGPAPVLPPALDLPWPPDDSRTASATFNFSGANTAGFSSATTKSGFSVFIRAGSEPFGWAIFKIGGFSLAKAPLSVTLNSFSLNGGGRLWLAAANRRRGSWEWIAAWDDGLGLEPVWYFTDGRDYVSTGGNVYLAFAIAGADELDINSGQFTLLDESAGPPYPRLGMWYPSWERNSVAECARYDVIIDDLNKDYLWAPAQGKWSAKLRAANPQATLLQYVDFSEIDYTPGGAPNPWLADWPAGWFLTEAGTTLASAVDAAQTQIEVADWQHTGEAYAGRPNPWEIFHAGGDVLCGGEIMTVTALDAGAQTLSVERAKYGRSGGAHGMGTRIAPLIRFWPGTLMMNLTNACPTAQLHGAPAPEDWGAYYLRMARAAQPGFADLSGDFDGLLFDRMEDDESLIFWDTANSADLDGDNTPDSFAAFDAAWLAGIEQVTAAVQSAWPAKPILRNVGGGRRFGDYNGNHFEAWPNADWAAGSDPQYEWHWQFFGDSADDPFGGVNEWASLSPTPNLSWVETYYDDGSPAGDGDGGYDNPFDKPGFTPDYRKLRLGLASALLGGAYFSYEINTNGHGSLGLLWFDEYDNARGAGGGGRGYLGYPASPITRLYAESGPFGEEWGVWGRDYGGGYVLVNPLAHSQAVELPPGRWRRIAGAQQPGVNSGALYESTVANPASVTLPAQDGLLLTRVQL